MYGCVTTCVVCGLRLCVCVCVCAVGTAGCGCVTVACVKEEVGEGNDCPSLSLASMAASLPQQKLETSGFHKMLEGIIKTF